MMNKDLSLKPFTEKEIRSKLSPLFKGKDLRLAIIVENLKTLEPIKNMMR